MMRLTRSTLLVLAASSSTLVKPFIINGEDATPGHFPYFAHFDGCGGTLIAPDIVLTAAHCGDLEEDPVFIGAYEESSFAYGAQKRFCEVQKNHPLYNREETGSFDYDFSLCRLDEPVTIDSSFVSLELNEADDVPSAGEDLILIGFDSVTPEEGEEVFPDVLQNVTLPCISEFAAESDFGSSVTDNMLCIGLLAGGKSACRGDSGGPATREMDHSWILMLEFPPWED